MDAEAGALVGCDIVANVPRYRGAGQKVPVDCEQVLFRSGDVLVVMQGRRHSVMVPVRRVRDQSVGVEHRF